ncbi:hypothetical protein PACILC2_02250 [Paenibacillus cisolokensis]|uniref:Carbohydrate ABC transporter permease n=1 Tax=Paenibacillus cisolokensis TaxID=1658519 RepID=A0ABQ4N0I7_9BACL|nr:hypothetical protein PACILC2_02250 [Paenibacillus cisolokensis]
MLSKYDTLGEKTFDVLNYLVLALFAAVTVLPFVYIIAGSFATEVELMERKFFLFPRDPSLSAYYYIFRPPRYFAALEYPSSSPYSAR